ncbi:DUF5301 domain-containing protein [Desulfitobacterium chlororespirans]|uniref:Signal transducer regulating beta-lactamase production, contains metallopeptidase domain n=1 Tax=Desulfitobacterium chlororespirans DSM 11544 TaxID=1121395 RepID=A0A1M7TYG1_9FIRM|nr:DUF5301 domain-containing protein [Desulfitobacterium chlororespirans]SHN75796.1 Signal transducer regulating beta-lactamase production, contains metallopeptidase domain [Desulfitobacterium chlororespirans DSM 11544]
MSGLLSSLQLSSSLHNALATVLSMSLTATYVAAVVILVRLFLKKAPKIFAYALWSVVLFRLLCPFSLPSDFSLLGVVTANLQTQAGVLEYVPESRGMMPQPTIPSGDAGFEQGVKHPAAAASPPSSAITTITTGEPLAVGMEVLSVIWLVGMVILLSYSVLSYLKTKRLLQTATLVKDNIYESDRLSTAFVFGFIRPKIYVPLGVSGSDLDYILVHEQTHIKRKDYLLKPLAFSALTLHWFNPVMWLSFVLMSRDMEMSCDESVLRRIGGEGKGEYAKSLLTLSVKRSGLFTLSPLAFGESHVKSRVKNILNYKKPGFWVVTLLAIAVGGMVFTLLVNPVDKEPDLSFLNPDNLASLLVQREGAQINEAGYPSPIIVSSVELGKWLDKAANDWKEKKFSFSYELTPSITIQVNGDNEIHFFEAEPTLAMIQSGEQYRYYAIPKEDFQVIQKLSLLGYPKIQSVTMSKWEKGEEVASVTSTDSTILEMAVHLAQEEKYSPFLFRYTSVNDTPTVSDYMRIIMEGPSVAYTYFLYTEDGKNYAIEKPYERINKINPDTAQAIIGLLAKAEDRSQDYIRAHPDDYERILKYGGEELMEIQLENLTKHLQKNGVTNPIIVKPSESSL